MSISVPEDQERVFREQLDRCGVESFDSYLVHNPCRGLFDTADRLGTFDFVRRLKEEGRVGRIGFSVHDDAEGSASRSTTTPSSSRGCWRRTTTTTSCSSR